MKPLSRGCLPEEFTLRIPCPLSQQFDLSGSASPHNFEVEGIRCAMELIDSALVISASGFSTVASAGNFFTSLQHKFAKIAVEERIAASFPTHYAEPSVASFSFIPGDTRCVSHGWPTQPIRPLLVPQNYASVYPEHEYVAIDEASYFIPTFTYSIASLAEKLGARGHSGSSNEPLDETILLAAFSYAHAARTTQRVWSFLLAVMTLEMLAGQHPTNSETRSAVAELVHHANHQYGGRQPVDLKRIRDCLLQAGTISKTRALRDLVKTHCAPGVANSPLLDVFTDGADCEKKVAAIYEARSKYVHEGRIKRLTKLKYPFEVLHNAALSSLGHILRILLAS